MKKLIMCFIACAITLVGSIAYAEECDPGLQPDFQLNTGGFDVNQFKKDNKPSEDTAQTVMFCFMGTTSGGMSPNKVFNDVCGCKEKIKKHCKIKKGKLKPNGVPKAWCAPFAPFLR